MSYRNEVIAFKETVKGTHFFVFDTETTGLSALNDDVIEFSAVKVNVSSDGDYEVSDKFDIYINPGCPIPEIITELTGITQEKIDADGVAPQEAAKQIKDFLGDNPIVMGYNSISFDTGFVNALLVKNGCGSFSPRMHLDVLKMAREKVEKPHKLINMAERFGVDKGLSFHTSIDDAMATFLVYQNIAPLYDEEPVCEELTITKVARWKKSESLDRIYVNNSQSKTIYYDVPKSEWVNFSDIDDGEVIRQVYEYTGVSSIDELLKIS